MDREAVPSSAGDLDALSATVEQFPLGIYAMDGPELRFVVANAAYRLAIKDEEIIGRPMRDAFGMEGHGVFEPIERVYTTGVPLAGEEWRLLLHPDDPDSEVIFTFNMGPWRNPDGSIRGVIGYIEDVTAAVQAREATESRLEAAQEIVLTLQRSLLPDAVPVLPGLRLAAHYTVAGEELQAGGDWFDVVSLEDGRLALVVGDVVGHGAAASAAMAQLRPVLHEALRSGSSATQAVDRLDAFAASMPATRAATVCVVVIDADSGAVEMVSRGHPVPLVCRTDGSTRFAADTGAGPLGVGKGPSAAVADQLAPGEVLLLYSDGLVERPGESLADGMARLSESAGKALMTQGRSVPLGLADRVTSLPVDWLGRTGYTDDVTVLAAHRLRQPAAGLCERGPASFGEITRLRAVLTDWLEALGAGRDDVLAVVLAAWEAVSNVVDHAYVGREPAGVQLDAVLDGTGSVEIVVTDQGTWREARSPASGGRGLSLIRAVADAMDVDRSSDGTRVRMRLRLTHPTTIGSPSAVAPEPVSAQAFDAVVTRVDPTVLSVRGPVDAGTTDLLRAALARSAVEGQRLVLDLSRVTFLASSGVQLLHELRADHGERLEFLAAPGSPAEYVLGLTGFGDLQE